MPPAVKNLKIMEEIILVIGNMGGDGGYSVLTPHGVVYVSGNNPMIHEAYAAMMKNYAVLQEAALKQSEMGGVAHTAGGVMA